MFVPEIGIKTLRFGRERGAFHVRPRSRSGLQSTNHGGDDKARPQEARHTRKQAGSPCGAISPVTRGLEFAAADQTSIGGLAS